MAFMKTYIIYADAIVWVELLDTMSPKFKMTIEICTQTIAVAYVIYVFVTDIYTVR